MRRRIAALGLFVVLFALSAPADTLLLYNTGLGLSAEAEDTHYTFAYWDTSDLAVALTTSPDIDNMPAWVVQSSGARFPFDPTHWMADTELSQWIAPKPYYADYGVQSVVPLSTLRTDAVGVYRIRYLFDLTGYIPSTASITGQWSSDNGGLGIYLNGVSSNQTAPWDNAGTPTFEGWHTSDLQANLFLPGLNTLDFYVYNMPDTTHNPLNYGNPVGLRVEMIGTADPLPVPEPSTLLLTSLALFGAFWLRRKP